MEENIKDVLRECLLEHLEGESVTLYHRIGNKKGMSTPELVKSVLDNGLTPNDNGEIGSVIWFSSDFRDYAEKANFVVSIEFNEETRKLYDLRYDGHNGYGRAVIPFSALKVEKIPVMKLNGTVDNKTTIDIINGKYGGNKYTPEKFNDNPINAVIYADLFNKYVQPYIGIDNYLTQLDSPRIEIINIP